ncbi:MAG TPA: hypothetical protein PKY95_07240 [candidate division Zixibacteria bacterium]|nr:hypothetical protein [candidate division Zixibacteria bacterium]
MSMSMDAIIAADLAATAFDTDAAECPAQTIGYTPAGGAEAEIPALLESGLHMLSDEGQGEQQRGEMVWLIRQSDVALPTAADLIAWEDKTYRVRDWQAAAVLWRVTAVRLEALQKRGTSTREPRA